MTTLALGLVGLRHAERYRRWLDAGVAVHGYDGDPQRVAAAVRAGVEVRASAVAVAQGLPRPRVVWLDVLPGRTTELAIQDVWPELARGELIVDGGDGDWRDARRREASLAAAGVHFADVALVDGELLVGGGDASMTALRPLLAAWGAWRHCGAAGAAHFVRMVHAGVAVATQAAREEAQALLAAHPELVHMPRAWPDRAPLAPTALTARGVVHAAQAAGLPAPVLSLALALAAGRTRAQDGDEDKT